VPVRAGPVQAPWVGAPDVPNAPRRPPGRFLNLAPQLRQHAGVSTDRAVVAPGVFRVAVLVESVNGFRGELTISPGLVQLSVRSLWARLMRRSAGPPLVQPGPDITLVHLRWELQPWFRAGLLLHKSVQRVYIPLTWSKAERLSAALGAAGFEVSEVTVRTFFGATGLLESMWLREAVAGSRRHSEPPDNPCP
jgi:hypothetical protein